GTMIEVYPEDITLRPGATEADQVVPVRNQQAPDSVSFHVLLSVSTSLGHIQRIGAREGWRTQLYGRGAPGQKPFFHVVEFWVENRIMLELVPEEMMDAYTELFQFPVLDDYFGMRKAA
ncbi:MAG TPA: hypothetical protein VE650_02065, partial [Acetobacteraceae bacterium]|nr:hypothetical protein [Acetobacteraceae bacterium]